MKNEYGNGRLSVIEEMEIFVKTKIKEIKDNPLPEDLVKRCTTTGVLSGYARVLVKLKSKKRNLLQHEVK